MNRKFMTPIMMAGITLLSSLPIRSFAFFDAAGWAIFGRQAVQMAKTADQAYQRYQQLQSQYNQMKEQYASITGNYGWGNWNNSLSNLTQQREWAASDWKSALQGMAGGNPERYQQLLSQYKANHQVLSVANYEAGTDKGLSTSYQNQVQTNEASATTATYEFNDINKHLKTLYQLGQQIENSKQNKDLKSAIDLNSRIELEVAYISTEELRMQTLLNQQMAQAQSHGIALENETAQYNQAGEQS